MNTDQRVGSEHRILSQAQIEAVHGSTLDLLEQVGVWVQSREALDILKDAGCDVRDEKRIKIPRSLVTEALETAPNRIEVFNQNGDLAMALERGACYYGTGSDCPTHIDLQTGERRATNKKDVEDLARFCDALPNIDFVMSFGIATNAPRGGNFVHQCEAMLLNTNKPIIVTGHGRRDMKTMLDMASARIGGHEVLRDRPPLVLYSEPLSPLIHTDMGVSKALMCAEYGVPFIYIGSPMLGSSGPATLAGTLVQVSAEALSGLVMFQQKYPGAKFIYGGDATCMDMQHSVFAYGAPELNLLNAALADMAHFYGLPFFCIAGATDAKGLDAQAGGEYALSIYLATMNGCNIIHDCGYLESGLTSSFESVLFADEVIDMVKYMIQPFEVNDETVRLDVIDRVGPGGSFLLDDHTSETFRKAFWFPKIMDRSRFGDTTFAGQGDLRSRLRQKAKSLLSSHPGPDISESVVAEIKRIVQNHVPDVS
jgi:trimethylamine--corrinoid protein Co-methyltransferase